MEHRQQGLAGARPFRAGVRPAPWNLAEQLPDEKAQVPEEPSDSASVRTEKGLRAPELSRQLQQQLEPNLSRACKGVAPSSDRKSFSVLPRSLICRNGEE